jgi:hypothetical protein
MASFCVFFAGGLIIGNKNTVLQRGYVSLRSVRIVS